MPVASKGNCYLCGAEISKSAMKNHILKNHSDKGELCALLKVESAENKHYWLYLDVPLDETLWVVDEFLRDIWLECCGHMSIFRTKDDFWDEDEDYGKDIEIGSLPADKPIIHDYDMGDTTETLVTVVGRTRRPPQKKSVRLLARNLPPRFSCGVCGAEAAFIERSNYSVNPFFCAKCAKKRDPFRILPVTNSPRMGVCGYEGERDIYAFSAPAQNEL